MGSSGNLVCLSFYPNKDLATAEGGAIALVDAAHADRLRDFLLPNTRIFSSNRLSPSGVFWNKFPCCVPWPNPVLSAWQFNLHSRG